jgi:hypothetical protein
MNPKTKKRIVGGLILLGIGGAFYYTKQKGSFVKSKQLDSVASKIQARYNAANKKFIDSLNPEVRERFKNFINDIIASGYAVVITSAYRSSAEQAVQKKANKNNATPGYSPHEYGIGIDLNLVKGNKWINKDSPNSEWEKTGVVKLAKNKYGFEWGGDFPKYHDPVHFADTKRYKVPTLYAKALKIYGTPEKIQGNKMKLAA